MPPCCTRPIKATRLFAGTGQAAHGTLSVNGSLGFNFLLDGAVQTLSSNSAPKESITGLLFVPSLLSDDECNNMTMPFVSSNVTRQEDVSGLAYGTIGLAPWVSTNCTRSFLTAAHEAAATALIFFQPGSNDTGQPPAANDQTWDLNDQGTWKDQNGLSVYAVPGPAGATLMHQLSIYSGNSTSNGQSGNEPTPSSDQLDPVRVFAVIDLATSGNDGSSDGNPDGDSKSQGNMRALWPITFIILGIIVTIGLMLIIAHRLVRRRRWQGENVQRPVTGEMDVEPSQQNPYENETRLSQAILDTLPLYIYPDVSYPSKAARAFGTTNCNSTANETSYDKKDAVAPQVIQEMSNNRIGLSDPVPGTESVMGPELTRPAPAATITAIPVQEDDREFQHRLALTYSQATCAICLDDFVPGSSIIRELPCNHIFHSECIDLFLTQNSSLCPLCKRNVLLSSHLMSIKTPSPRNGFSMTRIP